MIKYLVVRTCELALLAAIVLLGLFTAAAVAPCGGFGFAGALAVREGEVVQFEVKVGKIALAQLEAGGVGLDDLNDG